MKKKETKNKNRWKIISLVGILVIHLVLFFVLINKNNEIEAVSQEIIKAMTYAEFQEGDNNVEGTDNVKFSAFFLRDINSDGHAEKLKGTCKEIGKSDVLYMEIIVQTEGYLKDAKIQVNGQNFYLQTALTKDNELKNDYIGNNIKQIEFNQLASGTQKSLIGVVKSGDYNDTSTIADAIGNDTNKYSREDNEIILTGTYVDQNGNETAITKKVDLTIDWYVTSTTVLNDINQDKDTNVSTSAEDIENTYMEEDMQQDTYKELDASLISQMPSNEDGKESTESQEQNGYITDVNEKIETTSEVKDGLDETKTQGTVIVHHYIEGSTNKVPLQNGTLAEDEIKIGEINSEYTTEAATDIQVDYELAETPSNATGIITLENTEVIYYYKLKTPNIEKSEIIKTTTTKKVTDVGEKIPYTITYTANIDQYIGDGVVTIVDQLPYTIDTTDGKSSLDGGIYDEINKTITWTENITGIDTFTNGIKQINITKNIELTYKDLDVTKDKIANTSTGKIELKTPEKENTVTTSKEIPIEFLMDLKVTKVWQDTEKQSKKRPRNVILVLKNGDMEVTRQEINASNQEDEDTSKWSYTFSGLSKYDENRNEINYTVDELEKQENDLYFYTKTIGEITGTGNNKEVTITDTFTKPDDEISIKVNNVWVDQDNIYQKRPASLELQIKYGVAGDEATSKTIAVGTEDSYTFENLDKYDENGDEIIYAADEKEVNEGDLFNYTKQVGALENIEGQIGQKQITITNTMEKMPAKVTVKYVDKISGNEISDAVVKEGIIGETFNVTENKKDIEGYILVEKPAEKTGIYTEEEQSKTYYYIQNTKMVYYILKSMDKLKVMDILFH
ncbi:MAG: Cna B-type domain-containing protein [Clostridia bacterium]|nr:Cna B-type domain-containing protein [Clostridia bacterium]